MRNVVVHRCLVLVAALLTIAGGSYPAYAQAADETYILAPDLTQRALSKLFAEIGHTPRVARIHIEPERLTVRVQGEARPYDMDEWRAGLFRRFLFDRDIVSGPDAVQDTGIVREAEGAFFDLAEVALQELPAVVGRAIERAGLEDTGMVPSVTIERRVSILPERAYGVIRWTIPVTSSRESATVYANAAGQIIGADLSQTSRAKRLDIIAQDDWPMTQAQADLEAVIGPGESVHRVYLYNSHISVEADHPTDQKQERGYSWDLSGVKRGLVDTPSMLAMGMGGQARFRMADLDLTALPKIKQAARGALGMPTERILVVSAEKSIERPGQPRVLWTVEIDAGNSERGEALVSPDGEVIEFILPESRRPVEPWLAPATLVKTMARLEKTFGRDARFIEISINDERAGVIVEDPIEPGAVADFTVDAEFISRFPRAGFGPPNTGLTDGRAFTLADLAPITEEQFASLQVRTLERMKLQGAEVYRYTFWRHGVMVSGSQGKPIVEVRAGKDHGWTGGWVVYELDGTEIDVVLP